MTTPPRFLLEHINSSHVFEIVYHLRFLLDETSCSGKFLRHFYDYTFRSVYMSLSTLLYFANQNYLVYIRTLYWLCTLVFEIYFSTLKHEAISIRVFTEKHPYTIKGQLFEEFNRKSGKRTEAYEVESSFLSKRWKKSWKHQSFRPECMNQRRLDSYHVNFSTNQIALFFTHLGWDFCLENLQRTEKTFKNIHKYLYICIK